MDSANNVWTLIILIQVVWWLIEPDRKLHFPFHIATPEGILIETLGCIITHHQEKYVRACSNYIYIWSCF